MAGLGVDINGTIIGFDDLAPEAWGRVNRVANQLIVLDERGQEQRATWLDIYANPMKDPDAARTLHEEAVRVAEPACPDVAARSRELAPSIMTVNKSFCVVEDDVPVMQDGVPLEGAADQ